MNYNNLGNNISINPEKSNNIEKEKELETQNEINNQNIIIISKNKLSKELFINKKSITKKKDIPIKLSLKPNSSSNEEEESFQESLIKDVIMLKKEINLITNKINKIEDNLIKLNEKKDFNDINFQNIITKNYLSQDYWLSNFYKKEYDYKDEDGLNFHLYRFPEENKELNKSFIIKENSESTVTDISQNMSKNIKNEKFIEKKRKSYKLFDPHDSSSPNWSFFNRNRKKKKKYK